VSRFPAGGGGGGGAGVSSFNGRSGAVVSTSGDYTAGQVGAQNGPITGDATGSSIGTNVTLQPTANVENTINANATVASALQSLTGDVTTGAGPSAPAVVHGTANVESIISANTSVAVTQALFSSATLT
jgi:hypothetical protein